MGKSHEIAVIITVQRDFNVNYTANMQIIVQSWIVQVLRIFSSGDIIGNFTIFEG